MSFITACRCYSIDILYGFCIHLKANVSLMFESKISQEVPRKIFELTLALYRVTDFFPKDEALRRQLREKANEIFGGISEYLYAMHFENEIVATLAKIETMKGYLRIARAMRFVRSLNMSVLEREYGSLSDFLTKELEGNSRHPYNEKTAPPEEKRKDDIQKFPEKPPMAIRKGEEVVQMSRDLIEDDRAVNERQKKIVEHIKKMSQARLSDFFSFFHDITPKTIQRDLQALVAKNILKKQGEKRWTIYSLKDN